MVSGERVHHLSFACALPPIIAVQGALLMLLALSLAYAGAQIRHVAQLNDLA